MVTDQPLSAQTLAQHLGLETSAVESTLESLAAEYAQAHDGAGRGFVLRATAGWRIYSHPDFAGDIAAFLTQGQSARLSKPPSRR